MTQEGSNDMLADRGFEDFLSCKKMLKSIYGGRKVKERLMQLTQTTPTSATPSELWQKGGLTMTDKTKTELTVVAALDTNDDAYDGATLTGHYLDSEGTAVDFMIDINTTDSTTEVAIGSDFYCWNLRDYTPATVLVLSVAVEAGQNLYVGTTGMVAGAELRLATIAAAATYPVVTTLFGAGDLYGKEETDTAADRELICTLSYWTPWGKLKTGFLTLNDTDSTTIVRLVDINDYPVLDFYRVCTFTTTQAAGKYIGLGYDADKRVGTVALDTWYAVIEEGNAKSLHSRLFAPAAAEGALFTGKISICTTNTAKIATVHLYYTPKGNSVEQHRKWDCWGLLTEIDFAEEVEPLTEITVKLSDDAATPVNATVRLENIFVDLAA